jgi:hypothetical protein
VTQRLAICPHCGFVNEITAEKAVDHQPLACDRCKKPLIDRSGKERGPGWLVQDNFPPTDGTGRR